MKLKLNLVTAEVFTLAADQNAYPLFRELVIETVPTEDGSDTVSSAAAKRIAITLSSDPEFFQTHEWHLDEIGVGQSIHLQKTPLKIYHQKLAGLTEEISVTFLFSVTYEVDGAEQDFQQSVNIQFLPKDYWGGERRQQDLLAAFVQPNTSTVESLCSQVGLLLRAEGKGSQLDGYQSNSRDRPYLMASALWSTVFNERLTYVSPPQDWALKGQRIRFPEKIIKHRAAACLDTSVLFASCLEAMGLNPIIALTKTHAFAGVWLIDERFPLLTTDDAMDLRKRIAMADLVVFETTLVTNDRPVTFKQAIDKANELLREENETNFVMMIDIKAARARQIKPLALFDESSEEAVSKATSDTTLGLGMIPPLPPVKPDDQQADDTSETRVDLWRRKLLDLTKRNPLLSTGTAGLRIYCPNLPALEDKLASGIEFSFLAATESPQNDSDRDPDQFRLTTGNSLHEQYALEQLDRNVFVVNEHKPRLETKLIELYRKAKNDMLEGGTNTLFLAVGMLKWTDTPQSGKYYRAPLVLIPVVLDRTSARASVRLKQIPEEDPIFNLTLIEMLRVDYEINLDRLKNELPTDQSGVDVKKVWDTVRHAIRHTEGFEVTEELILGTFSFAKYLMWKDLTDRIDQLQENPFVDHLVERPQQTYPQSATLIKPSEIDSKIKPRDFFAPLKCDSSQIVAIEASSKSQDFVLEGPPGTGKSETIANVICHNIALGRKILFVSEKMEALNVVYRRIENIGLDHLCLELHSNKANKKEVITQLHRAWTQREKATPQAWQEQADRLEQIRAGLNQYVLELHKPRNMGISARAAISRKARFESVHKLRLDWKFSLETLPFQTDKDLEELLNTVRDVELAFDQIRELDSHEFGLVTQTTFSNQWSSQLVDMARMLSARLTTGSTLATQVLTHLKIPRTDISLDCLLSLKNLQSLLANVPTADLRFALESGAKERLKIFADICYSRTKLDTLITKLGPGFKTDLLDKAPIDSWITIRDQNPGFFGMFKRRAIHAGTKQLGMPRIKDLSLLDLMYDAQSVLTDMQAAISRLTMQPSINFYTASQELLEASLDRLRTTHKSANVVVSYYEEPLAAAKSLREKLYELSELGSDESILTGKTSELISSLDALVETIQDAEKSALVVDRSELIEQLVAKLDKIATHSNSLPRWCKWLAVKQTTTENHLNSVVSALEAGAIAPSEACETFKTALCIWLAPKLVDSSEVLSQFSRATHEDKIRVFQELDAMVAETTSHYIAAIVAQKSFNDPDDKKTAGQFGVLSREAQKKTRHMPIRQLINEMRDVLFDLTPCLMMSPLSVAQFLPADLQSFDLVVFDEASQITTWDAVGAIARGKNAIIVGDPKQMPPSNHFGRADGGDDADLESILDQALAAALPHLRLTGHYRSRHETLIAFSNAQYYDNSLVTYPSADTKQSAVRLCRVDGVYAKGTQRTNPKEAQAVVNELIVLLTDMLSIASKRSIGIVTINSEQERLVNDLIDDARRKNPALEPFFQKGDDNEEVFVKNLESVQGDQRDIIMLSLTYGPTEPGSRSMSMNFGPLNREGGERRLNVAVTRATTEVIVFSSFDSTMIDLTRTKALAVQHLKNYLEFAERGPIALAQFNRVNQTPDQFDSDFEMAVASILREQGWAVQTQVGVSLFRVDLGVIHPDEPGRFIAGIECDGATYHGSPSARDRDRVRQAVLENLGWNIIRVWSTDFFQDPEFAMKRVFEQLDKLLKTDRNNHPQESDQKEIFRPVPEMNNLRASESIANDVPNPIVDEHSSNDELVSDEELQPEAVVKYAAALKVEPGDIQQTESLPEQNQTQNDASVEQNLPKEDFFNPNQKAQIAELAKAILTVKNGITLHELTADIAAKYGISRTSSKQQEHVRKVIAKWAGIKNNGISANPTVWLSPDDVIDVIHWRGVAPFGQRRSWNELPYQEQIGLALEALKIQPANPVDWMFNALGIGRRRGATAKEFEIWVERAKTLQK